MEALALYLIKSTVWLTGFALVYLLFLRNERFFLLNRIYLVAGILASIIFPLFTWRYTVVLPVTPSIEVSELQMVGIESVPEPFPTQTILFYMYLAGALYLLFRLTRQTITVLRVIQKSEILPYRSAKLIRTAEYPASFSFFSFVFVNPSTCDTETNEIVNHEMEHVRQQHWIDLLLFEILCTLQWFNPMCWLYGRFIRQNHEYLADERALQRSSNPGIYRAALLNQLFGGPVISLANSFNYSINKKRFNMMKQTIYSPIRKLKLLLVLPLMAGVFYAFATPEYKYAPTAQEELLTILDTRTVTGKVVNEEGVPLKGASVVIAGTNIGTITDNDGNFVLQMTDDSPLVISYVGYESQKVTPSLVIPSFDQKIIISMKKVNIGVDEVVVVGYGTNSPKITSIQQPFKIHTNDPLQFRNSDGSNTQPLVVKDGVITENQDINSIPPETIQSVNVIKGEQAISKYGDRGKNGVVEITVKSENKATLNPTIQVQTNSPLKFGNTDGSKAQPLIVKDGVILENQNVNSIPPENIESISVLKGESATALYGEKGKNGVIFITMKKGINFKNEPIDVQLDGDRKDQKEGKVYQMVEEMPQFPGGANALRQFIASNVKYPAIAHQNGIQGKVYVSFVVSKTGSVTNAKITWGIDPSLDREALRVVNSLPPWTPGKQNGENVAVEYTLPINFVLEGKKTDEAKTSDSPVFFIVEEMPTFPGGEEALRNFLASNVKYPAEAQQNGIQGKVYINFVVTKTGSIANAKVARGVNPLLDQEAIRVVNLLPTWTPGKQKGENVAVSYTIPINFALENKNPESAKTSDSPVFFVVEEMPEFPGGDAALRKFIGLTVKYPVEAQQKGIQGKVYINFVVTKTGSVTNAKVARGVDPLLDQEAIRVVNSLPTWKPGKQKGENVDVSYTVPINFVLGPSKISDEKLKETNNPPAPAVTGETEKPEFPGGEEALRYFLAAHIQYPEIARKKGIQGKVYVSFVVTKTGSVDKAKVVKGVDPSLDQEAIRVIQSMPAWKPGTKNGENIYTALTLPINFSLDPANEKERQKLAGPSVQKNKLIIVPNPTQNVATVTLEGSDSTNPLEVSIFNNYGKLMSKESKNGPSFSLTVSNLTTGTYLVVATDGTTQYQGQMIVNH